VVGHQWGEKRGKKKKKGSASSQSWPKKEREKKKKTGKGGLQYIYCHSPRLPARVEKKKEKGEKKKRKRKKEGPLLFNVTPKGEEETTYQFTLVSTNPTRGKRKKE